MLLEFLGIIIAVVIANFITISSIVQVILPKELIDAIKLYFQDGIDKLLNSSKFDNFLNSLETGGTTPPTLTETSFEVGFTMPYE
jgi:hypothetical protein